ncbi:hypothetical protein [Blastococcus sp. TF02A-35]|uniref:hypothetical protein n=1 Tax=Blastococcus sp. TF02A-35 TaxID=2559612 RepID=UPI001074441E|nr:hypothetical protein [Blastococcus sp. TF02A_35]TFV48155.1 hypothetical protein E4P43_14355 [Blastococcus sp. TF02A_35]
MSRTPAVRTRRALQVAGLVLGVLVAGCSTEGGAPAGQASAEAPSGGWTAAEVSDVTEVAPYDGSVVARNALVLSSSAAGTVTRGAAVGETLHPGQLWLHVDEKPVTVAPGAIPMYRDLLAPPPGGPPLKGDDVRQLQQFLTAEGEFAGSVNGAFSDSLGRAAARWRDRHGMGDTPGFARAELAFLAGPGPWTVTEVTVGVGEAFSGGEVLTVSSGDLAVTVELDGTPPDGAVFALVPVAGAGGEEVPLTPTGAATLTPENKYALQLAPPPGAGALTAGTSVIVEQRVVLATGVVTVPVAAVRVDAAGDTYVECRGPGAGQERCPVALGPTNGTDVAVTEGLSAGTEVATTP